MSAYHESGGSRVRVSVWGEAWSVYVLVGWFASVHCIFLSCGFHVVRCTPNLRCGILCYCALHAHLVWGSVLLCTARPSCVGFCIIVRCTPILRGILCYCTLHTHLAWDSVSLGCCIVHSLSVAIMVVVPEASLEGGTVLQFC